MVGQMISISNGLLVALSCVALGNLVQASNDQLSVMTAVPTVVCTMALTWNIEGVCCHMQWHTVLSSLSRLSLLMALASVVAAMTTGRWRQKITFKVGRT